MRFTTWSTLKSTFIFSTVALLSLIPAASAVGITFTHPTGGEVISVDNPYTDRITWSIDASGVDLSDDSGNLILVDGSGNNYLLESDVSLLGGTSGEIHYPTSGENNYIRFDTQVGTFYSGSFDLYISR